ncbi:uncharacterized protein MELLADRAFT_66319 [Melampsora larici-populina 98AG31]|uniref:Secreted protein n=1 Tax=Melampsora larici-populina (strain 98AG31 / pathotype 3-4-7) TaxID=747676 RepID=F4RYQ2_MELLP|nr:uncharacterized protein MELLADRAFT_66319 [Melampsora larici-populina 98AG31]EGG02537.1 secreted protein [Melampsora larici-populina 98AG31]
MRINYSFVATSISLLFAFDFTNMNNVSASPGFDPSRIRTLLRRSLNTRSHKSGEEINNDESVVPEARPIQQSGVPQLGLSPEMMKKISDGLVGSIAKFSADKFSGIQFPTQQEMSQSIQEAILISDHTNFFKVTQAIKNSIDALADRKLAESQTGKSRSSNVPKLSSPSIQSCAEQIAAALLSIIEMFCEEKSSGGRLPTSSEVNKALTPAFQRIDFSNLKKSSEVVKSGLEFDQMSSSPKKNSIVQGLPLPPRTNETEGQA